MSPELTARLEALRLWELELGSLFVADEITALLEHVDDGECDERCPVHEYNYRDFGRPRSEHAALRRR